MVWCVVGRFCACVWNDVRFWKELTDVKVGTCLGCDCDMYGVVGSWFVDCVWGYGLIVVCFVFEGVLERLS